MKSAAAVFLYCFVLAVVCVRSASAQMQMSPVQKEVWAGEEAYCHYRVAGDLEGFMSLWDESFIGWPLRSMSPGTKATIKKLIADVIAAGAARRYECQSTPLAVNVFGDVANTYYLFHDKTTDSTGKTLVSVLRISHTWRRFHGRWRIIGGMAAPHPMDNH